MWVLIWLFSFIRLLKPERDNRFKWICVIEMAFLRTNKLNCFDHESNFFFVCLDQVTIKIHSTRIPERLWQIDIIFCCRLETIYWDKRKCIILFSLTLFTFSFILIEYSFNVKGYTADCVSNLAHLLCNGKHSAERYICQW